MMSAILNSILAPGAGIQIALLVMVAAGALLVFYGVVSSLSGRTVAAERMAPKQRRSLNLERSATADLEGKAPKGISAALIPSDASLRFEVGQALARAGFRGENAVAGYYTVRLILALSLPLLFLGGTLLADQPGAPSWLVNSLRDVNALKILQYVAVLCAVGFFGPAYWLRARIEERKRRLEEAFPNTLDLLQVGVDAGMGFDQALLKVATEIQLAAPEMAEEFLTALSEIQAGRDRDIALMRMARRTGIDELSSFVNVVLQSSRFGSPLSDVLTTYADEMRELRELKAQEKANKLPVQMSAVMAALMLPSLIALILAPIIIRYMLAFGGA